MGRARRIRRRTARHAGHADRRVRAGVEGQQQQLEMRPAAVLARGDDAGDSAERLVGDDGCDFLDFAAAGLGEHRRKALVLEIEACERTDAGAGDAERKAEFRLAGQDEDVAEQLAYGGRVDIGPVRRPRTAALLVPICEERAARRMFHD